MADLLPAPFPIQPRDVWARELPVPPPMDVESRGDVRILVVHHSASPNTYLAEEVPSVLRGFHRFHTGPEKGWPDIAYNFLVDRFGGVWEGRAGSLAGPVRGDATGGSQGFSQLVCLVGDHSIEPPTAEAQASVVAVLAWLADRYDVSTAEGARARFVSRGSNLWPAGAEVDLPTIAGHRQVSQTTCPGDAALAWVRDELPARVEAARSSTASSGTADQDPTPVESSTSDPEAPSTSAPAAPTPSGSPAVPVPTPPRAGTARPASAAGSNGSGSWAGPVAGLAAAAAAVVAAAIRVRRRRL